MRLGYIPRESVRRVGNRRGKRACEDSRPGRAEKRSMSRLFFVLAVSAMAAVGVGSASADTMAGLDMAAFAPASTIVMGVRPAELRAEQESLQAEQRAAMSPSVRSVQGVVAVAVPTPGAAILLLAGGGLALRRVRAADVIRRGRSAPRKFWSQAPRRSRALFGL